MVQLLVDSTTMSELEPVSSTEAGVCERLIGERALERGQSAIERIDLVAHPEPEIGRHLVVARARGM